MAVSTRNGAGNLKTGLSCVVAADAMTTFDYLAIGVLIVLALWAVAAVRGKS
jgi:hypothetical protein